jgi:hypothetical protein
MVRDRSANADPDEPAPDEADVIALGEDDAPRRRRTFRWLDRVRADARFPPLAVAGLGLAGVFGSLVGEWATMTPRELAAGPSQVESNEFSTGASDIGIGPGYLVGILAIVALTAVAIFGTPPVRRNARIAGMATSGGLLLLLVAGTLSLDATAQRRFMFGPQFEVDIRYGPGLTLAYAGTAAMGLALYLAGRSSASRPVGPADGGRGEPDPPGDRHRHRRQLSEDDEPVRDVTVLPAPPFTGPDWRQQYPQ